MNISKQRTTLFWRLQLETIHQGSQPPPPLPFRQKSSQQHRCRHDATRGFVTIALNASVLGTTVNPSFWSCWRTQPWSWNMILRLSCHMMQPTRDSLHPHRNLLLKLPCTWWRVILNLKPFKSMGWLLPHLSKCLLTREVLTTSYKNGWRVF